MARTTPHHSRRARGQSAVETAITMPMFVFVILGLLQLGLMYQARLMTKYAAYKAVRAGSIHNAKMSVMKKAAMGVLLPFMAQGDKQAELTFHATSASEYNTAWNTVKSGTQDTANAIPWVEVTICNPTKSIHKNHDFDDPVPDQFYPGGRADWKFASSTRLNVQVLFLYRMPIPFANGILWWITHGQEDMTTMRVLRMNTKQGAVGSEDTNHESRTINRFEALANEGKYVLPIRNSFGMRMHSNFFPDEGGFELPAKNECRIPYTRG